MNASLIRKIVKNMLSIKYTIEINYYNTIKHDLKNKIYNKIYKIKTIGLTTWKTVKKYFKSKVHENNYSKNYNKIF